MGIAFDLKRLGFLFIASERQPNTFLICGFQILRYAFLGFLFQRFVFFRLYYKDVAWLLIVFIVKEDCNVTQSSYEVYKHPLYYGHSIQKYPTLHQQGHRSPGEFHMRIRKFLQHFFNAAAVCPSSDVDFTFKISLFSTCRLYRKQNHAIVTYSKDDSDVINCGCVVSKCEV